MHGLLFNAKKILNVLEFFKIQLVYPFPVEKGFASS